MNQSEQFDDLYVAKAVATIWRKEFETILNQEQDDEETGASEIQECAR
jgi:hypothetical protein